MNVQPAASSQPQPVAAMAAAWNSFWFAPVGSRPLALVRIGTAALALVLWWSYAADVLSWFGPAGVLPADTVRQWRSPAGFSLFDVAGSSTAVAVLFGSLGVALVLLLVGLGTPVVAVGAAVLWASLLNRGPMLAGPADDCLAIFPAGDHLSVDRWLRDRRGLPAAGTAWRASIAQGLLQVHATAIAVASLLAQLKGDAWWDGLATWYLAAGSQSRLSGLLPALEQSEYLTNLLTHGITAFELLFAIGLWFTPTQRLMARVGLVAWPLIGMLAGEPWWGAAMALFTLPLAVRR